MAQDDPCWEKKEEKKAKKYGKLKEYLLDQ